MEQKHARLAGDEWPSNSIDAVYDDVENEDILNLDYIEL